MTAVAACRRDAGPYSSAVRTPAIRLRNHEPSANRSAGLEMQGVAPSVRVSLFGHVTLHVGDREITLASRKAKALIAYLLLVPGMKETRGRLAGLFWSETEEAKARASLRQLLHVVREAFDKAGVAGFSADKLYVSLDASAFATDLDYALASVGRGDPLDCLLNEARITDTFLSEYEDTDPSFGGWLRIKRESVRQRLIQGLEAKLSDTTLPVETAKRLARALFHLDPTHEQACRKLMCAYVGTGDIAGALAAYRLLWECLEEDHDIEPSAATQELVVAIKSGTYRPPIQEFSLPTPSKAAARDRASGSEILLALKLAVACMTMSNLNGSKA